MNTLLLLIGIFLIIAIIIFYYIINNILIPRPIIVPGFDKFGIKEIYPSKPGGEEWFMNMQDPNNDPRTVKTPHMTKNTDGSWKVLFNNNNNKSCQVKIMEIAVKMKSDMAYLHLLDMMKIK